jgi:hypothetical protein
VRRKRPARRENVRLASESKVPARCGSAVRRNLVLEIVSLPRHLEAVIALF